MASPAGSYQGCGWRPSVTSFGSLCTAGEVLNAYDKNQHEDIAKVAAIR